jgi:hypothetical protein
MIPDYRSVEDVGSCGADHARRRARQGNAAPGSVPGKRVDGDVVARVQAAIMYLEDASCDQPSF